MNAVFDFGLEATRWLQEQYPQLEAFFTFISSLGMEEFYLALLPLIYWCLDKRLGKHLGYLFLLSTGANALFKHAFRGPRPFWLEDNVGLSVEESYGVPSGHAQIATTVYLFVASWLQRRWIWVLALLMVLFMSLSRIYLGVHFVHDVVAGIIIALLLLAVYAVWMRRFAAAFAKRILGQKLLASFAVAAGFALVYALVRLAIGDPDPQVEWSSFTAGAELVSLEATATAVGALLGMGAGLNLEGHRLRYLVQGSWWKRLLRYVVGIAVTVAIWGGLKAVFPEYPLWLAIPLRILRYFLATLWIGYYAPVTFVRFGLADAEPDPGMDLSL